jgi:thiosulfate dehydrogenase
MRCGLWMVVGLMACGAPPPEPAPVAEPAPAPAPATAAAFDPATWTAPAESEIPEGPLGDSIRRGLDLFTHTSERLPEYSPGTMACSSCHLEAGRKLGAAALVGVAARFPKYMERTGAVIPLHDRVNYCFTRSLAGSRIPVESQEMVDLLAYLTFLSKGVPQGTKIPGVDIPELPRMEGDIARGQALYVEKTCVACHQDHGGGVAGAFPALWGDDSYSVGASMTREERAASFIQQFMPQTAPGSLTAQEAYDLAAYINSQPRRDSPGKENDWPSGGAPWDVPYDTQGHVAHRPAPVLPRPDPERSIVPPPPRLVAAP